MRALYLKRYAGFFGDVRVDIEDIVAVILNGKLKMAALAEAVGIAESAREIADEALILKGLQFVAA